MSELFSLLQAAAGQFQLFSPLGRWMQRISAVLGRLDVGWVGHAVCSCGSPSLVFDLHSVIWQKIL